jgi:dTDP-4-dehydrorhamnose 3,5-epimerase
MEEKTIFICGANGQLGTALHAKYAAARFADIDNLDITNEESVNNFDWSNIKIILNAAAYTNVDGAETPEGRVASWKVNATAVSYISFIARKYDITLVHISSDYVFDGSKSMHKEDEDLSPLSVYGASKAAGDLIVSTVPKHYILRTSWVIGEGKNFVRTMLEIGKKGVNPTVVSDQIGRLTFTSELVRAIDHLLTTESPYGTYNISNDGESESWAHITKKIYELAHLNNTVAETTTREYFIGKENIAPRPLQSSLDLTKIHATGFTSVNWESDLKSYIAKENL